MLTSRKAVIGDFDAILELTGLARDKMHSQGNFQWNGGYPGFQDFKKDLDNDALWIVLSDDKIVGVAALTNVITQDYIDAGCDASIPCVISHRIATHPAYQGKGIGSYIFNLAEEVSRSYGFSCVRIDTHEANSAMIHLIVDKFHYEFKGVLVLAGRGPPPELRNWYEKMLS